MPITQERMIALIDACEAFDSRWSELVNITAHFERMSDDFSRAQFHYRKAVEIKDYELMRNSADAYRASAFALLHIIRDLGIPREAMRTLDSEKATFNKARRARNISMKHAQARLRARRELNEAPAAKPRTNTAEVDDDLNQRIAALREDKKIEAAPVSDPCSSSMDRLVDMSPEDQQALLDDELRRKRDAEELAKAQEEGVF